MMRKLFDVLEDILEAPIEVILAIILLGAIFYLVIFDNNSEELEVLARQQKKGRIVNFDLPLY